MYYTVFSLRPHGLEVIFSDETIVNKFKSLADATKINVNKRHLGLPNIQELQDFAETYFQENIILIKELLSKNIKKNILLNTSLIFLISIIANTLKL